MPTALFIALALVPIGLGFAARFWLGRTFSAAGAVFVQSGITASQAAARLLEASRCSGISVEAVEGELTDHYDPGTHSVRLSERVAESSSVGALAVAAHEVGHAAQDRDGERVFRVQRAFVPVATFSSHGWLIAIAAGLFLESAGLVALALVLVATVAAFHVATLPVELDASRWALSLLATEGILGESELPVAHRVLRAAALTYVVAALT
ncbi:MAG: zinc metallopeptidase, partial [Gaiellaceae bacterium]